MTNKKNILFCACLCLLLAIIPPITQAADHLSVDTNTVIQKNFLGINAVYHAFTYMPESIEQGMNDDLRKIEFQRVKSSGIRIARTFYRPDWAMGDEAWSSPDWQSAKMQALYRWLAEMQKLNIDVALNIGWWFGRDVIWNRDQHLASYPDDMNKFAAWTSESLHQIIEVRGFTNVKYIFMFTEPDSNLGDLPGGKKLWPYYKKVVRLVDKKLRSDGRRHLVKMITPNTTPYAHWLEKAAHELQDVTDIFASHNYNYTTYKEWYDLAINIRNQTKKTAKPFWIDEYGVQKMALRNTAIYGNILAQANAAFLNAGAQTTMLWILNDQYYPHPLKYISNGDAFEDGLHKWGLFPWLPDNLAVRPAWYAFTMMSRLMGGGNGTKIYKTHGSENLHIAATGQGGSTSAYDRCRTAIMVVNGDNKGHDYSLVINDKSGKARYRYLYDPARIKKRLQPPILISQQKIPKTDHLPANGMVIYTNTEFLQETEDDWKLINTTPGNLAHGKIVTSTNSSKGHPSKNAVDGKRLSYWSSTPSLQASPESITIDLGKSFNLRQVDIYPRSDRKDKIGTGFPIDYTLAVSKNAKTWNKIAARHTPQKPDRTVRIIKFSPIETRYIKLNATTLRKIDEKNYVMQIGEIKAFAQ